MTLEDPVVPCRRERNRVSGGARLLLAGLLAGVILAGCTMASAPTTSDTTIGIANDSAITVIVLVNGTTIQAVAPGFRGPLTDAGAGGSPRTVVLTTVDGTQLGDPWDAEGGGFQFAMDPQCGTIDLWVGSLGPDLASPGTLLPSGCPI